MTSQHPNQGGPTQDGDPTQPGWVALEPGWNEATLLGPVVSAELNLHSSTSGTRHQ